MALAISNIPVLSGEVAARFVRTAEENAREGFRKLLRSMGYQKTVINFAK